ncbi:PC4-domain-containing protein [Rickenella mellea]|uniref:PC4-domain-containing protein n=1 Tax=Rickenella mellea TaxID=50990 RepID=A0A4Y7QHB9_9AGAM|nr:PC4-domain-containing protein [Rickenella mellea]
MAKRKSDSFEDEGEDIPVQSKKGKRAAEASRVAAEGSSDVDEAPLSKKSKNDGGKGTEVSVFANDEGEKYVDLGKKRRVVVRAFKGQPLIDIREFYGQDGDEKPGKKGIALTIDQWKELKSSVSTVDKLIGQLKK